jgi:hypothetical protein
MNGIINRIFKLLKIAGIPNGLSKHIIDKWIILNNIHSIGNLFFYCKTCTSVQGFNSDEKQLLMELVNNIKTKLSDKFTNEEFWQIINIPGLDKKKMIDISPLVLKKYNTLFDIMVYLHNKKVDLPANVLSSLLDLIDVWKFLTDIIPLRDKGE